MTTRKVSLMGASSSSGNLTVRVKHSISKQHFRAAVLFAKEARVIESTISVPEEADRTRHSAQVTAAVLSGVAFLEASINELFLSALSNDFSALRPSFDDESSILLRELWENVEGFPILRKYQIVLTALRKSPFETDRLPYQDADSLIRLRNSLVHYKPEWDDERGNHQKLEDRLKGKFAVSPYGIGMHLWFPHQCLGSGCADWAVATARTFSEEFCTRLAVPIRTP